MAKALGADEIIDVKEGDLSQEVKRLTDGKGVNAVLDFVASSQTLEAGFASLAKAGRLVILGYRPSSVFRADPSFRLDPVVVLQKGLEIHGSRYRENRSAGQNQARCNQDVPFRGGRDSPPDDSGE
jgi:NADPH:quinone reductase-like Zn-dependent oxidoreductase